MFWADLHCFNVLLPGLNILNLKSECFGVHVFIPNACFPNTLIPTKSVVLGEGMVPEVMEGDGA